MAAVLKRVCWWSESAASRVVWPPGLDPPEIERRTTAGQYLRASGMHLARFETNARRRDGTEFPADVSLARADTDSGLRSTCVVRDITGQRMAFASESDPGRGTAVRLWWPLAREVAAA